MSSFVVLEFFSCIIMVIPRCSRLTRQPTWRWILLSITAIAMTGCAKFQQMTQPPANAATVSLAEHLTQTGAKMYGTYWCPYCNKQEELFKDAVSKVQIVECDPQGENAQPQLCTQANVTSYPTWEINGKLYRGMRSLEELATLSEYKGPTNFK